MHVSVYDNPCIVSAFSLVSKDCFYSLTGVDVLVPFFYVFLEDKYMNKGNCLSNTMHTIAKFICYTATT